MPDPTSVVKGRFSPTRPQRKMTDEQFPTKGCAARSWDDHFSRLASHQESSILKSRTASSKCSDLISLGVGRPASEFYPWTSFSFKTTEQSLGRLGQTPTPTTWGSENDTGIALNYCDAAGSPTLLRFIKEHVEMIHKPPYQNWDCAISCGSTSAIDLIFQILCDPGDLILAEQFTYPGTLAAAKSQGLSVIHVAMDDEGLSATDLDRTLSTWSPPQGAKPQVLYMVPTGQNPTGCTQSNTRRAEIYRIAEEHDLLIIEDDPYYFLQLRSYLNNANYQENMRQQNDEYIATLPMSYLSLDRSGRVIRLDSTSKILAPGLRCGWITACSQVMSKILARTEVSTVAPNGPSQLMLVKLLRQQWDHAGLFSWLRRLSARYHERRDVLLRACERYLPTPMCSWKVPAEGMFVWVTVASDTSTPNAASLSSDECLFLEDRIFVRAKELGVLIGRGSWFQAHDLAATAIQFRLTFAAAKMDELETAVCRFGQALSSFVELGVGTHD